MSSIVGPSAGREERKRRGRQIRNGLKLTNLQLEMRTMRGCRSERAKIRSRDKGGKFLSEEIHITEEPEYSSWIGMLKRCFQPNSPGWKRYGGRGITVCQEWVHSYESFLAHVGRRPSPNHSIDRINNDGNYEPGNVKWSDSFEQMNNTKYNRFLSINGETLTISQWAQRTGKKYNTIHERLRRGWTAEDAILKSVRL